MIKDFLAFLGLVFLTIVIMVSVAVVGYLYGFLDLIPQELASTTSALVDQIRGPVEVQVADAGTVAGEPSGTGLTIGEPQWSNPLEALPAASWTPVPLEPTPTATSTPTPPPTATPIPPLDAGVYRTEVTVQLKAYVSALERWLEANRQLGQDNAMLRDSAWRENMMAILNEIESGGETLAAIGPPPVEYQGVHMLLVQIGQSSGSMSGYYRRALDSGATLDFRQAGEEFVRIKAYLAEVVNVMVELGWTIEP